jgi:drug/metabolite transporter (DMT)-like permease
MWVAFSLASALGAAATNLILKRALLDGGVVLSTITFRVLAGMLLAVLVFLSSGWPPLTPGYWRAVALVIPPEVAGMVCMTLALRAGDLSMVGPLMGFLPLFVTISGFVFLGEVPAPPAALGIVFVTSGIYGMGLRPGGSFLEPVRSLARTRASWFAVSASFFWSFAMVVHKIGIAEVGPFPWAATLTLGSSLALAAVLPVLGWKTRAYGFPVRWRTWAALMGVGGICFAVQQTGLHLALGLAHAGYVSAVNGTSILIGTAFGIFVLRERTDTRNRVVGAALVFAGAGLIALFG